MDSSELRSQQVIILSKARHYFYLTKDRLLSLSKNSNKKLNNHLSVYIKIVENDLKQCSSDITLNNYLIMNLKANLIHSMCENEFKDNSAKIFKTHSQNNPNICEEENSED